MWQEQKMWCQRRSRTCHRWSSHILTTTVIYYWTVAQQHDIYLFKIKKSKMLLMVRLSMSVLHSIISNNQSKCFFPSADHITVITCTDSKVSPRYYINVNINKSVTCLKTGSNNWPKPKLLTLYTLTSVWIFSILIFIHFLSCWPGEFVCQSKGSFPSDQFLFSHDLNVWFMGDLVGRN